MDGARDLLRILQSHALLRRELRHIRRHSQLVGYKNLLQPFLRSVFVSRVHLCRK